MKRISIKKLCFMMGSLGLVASANVGAFPSAAWFSITPGNAIVYQSNGNPAYGYKLTITPKPVYLNGQQGYLQQQGDSFDVFSMANDGINFLGTRHQHGDQEAGCTDTFSPPVHIPDNITLGTPYTTTGTVARFCAGNPGMSGSSSFTVTFTPLLFEDVTVPAGIYKALKGQFQVQMSGLSVNYTDTSWYAPKIGQIKWSDDVDTDSATFISSNVPDAGNADHDGDGKSDPTVFRGSDGTWRSRLSSNNTLVTRAWGQSGDQAVQGDYDGDGKHDFAVFRPSNGTWYILKSSTNFATYFSVPWGSSTDKTVQRDYDGDGVQDIAIYRNGTWYIKTSSTGFTESITKQFGAGSDNPVPRDFDGDGKADLAVFRPSNGTWYWSTSSSGYTDLHEYQWGKLGDQPIARDFDGDGKADLGLYRPSTGSWYIKFSSSVYTTSMTKVWGIPTGSYTAGTSDTPVSGDFDGDRINDIAIFRPTDGKYYVLTSSSNFNSSLILNSVGTTGDLPVSRK